MKGIVLTIFIILSIGYGIFSVNAMYEYKKISSNWDLADRSSTIQDKIVHIDNFVLALEAQNLNGKYGALFIKTQDNSFDANLNALKSLQQRLHEIKDMPVSSFEYQTAMQQITGQEQGEANEMLGVFSGAWAIDYSIFIYKWVAFCVIIFLAFGLILGFIILSEN